MTDLPHLHRTLEEQRAWLHQRGKYVLTSKPGSCPKHNVRTDPNVAATIQAEKDRIAAAEQMGYDIPEIPLFLRHQAD
jgi:hypothetical protein